MAHQISFLAGQADTQEGALAVYAIEDGKAWHGFGKAISAEIDRWIGSPRFDASAATASFDASALAAKQACPQLLSTFTKLPVFGRTVEGEYFAHPTAAVIRRDCDGYILPGVVGLETFSLPEPRRLLILARSIVAQRPNTFISFMGYLAEGSKFVVSVNLGRMQVAGEDHAMFLTLYTGMDGSKSTEIMISLVRAVCANTVIQAQVEAKSDQGSYTKIRRTSGAPSREDKAVDTLSRAMAEVERGRDWLEALSRIKLTAARRAELVAALLKAQGRDVAKSTRAKNTGAEILHLAAGAGIGMDGHEDTAYGLWQAVTEYEQHHSTIGGGRSADGTVKSVDKVLSSKHFGGVAARCKTAQDILTEALGPDMARVAATAYAATPVDLVLS